MESPLQRQQHNDLKQTKSRSPLWHCAINISLLIVEVWTRGALRPCISSRLYLVEEDDYMKKGTEQGSKRVLIEAFPGEIWKEREVPLVSLLSNFYPLGINFPFCPHHDETQAVFDDSHVFLTVRKALAAGSR